jgi:phosphoglycerol transferase MdoB-like AlkP superfamily enzyme
MPCLLVLLVVGFPRLVLVLMWLFSNTLDRAYHNLVIPLLGFLFLPVTTIVYAWMVSQGMPLAGINLVILIIAVLVDAGSHGSSARSWSRR